jgi:outer membrane receptor protein involved in Fe transport
MRGNVSGVGRLRGGIALLGGLACGLPALAQEGEIGEIIVTTRNREENLQEVPIAVTAIGAEDLQRKGISDVADVLAETSSLILDQGISPQDVRVVVRGLSPTRGRPNVAFLQDGIDISSESVASAGSSLLSSQRLFELERVEVVKGPQSALYGRSAFNGAINYITRRPGDSFRSSVSAEAGSGGVWQATGTVSGPVVPGVLKLGLNAATWNEDGFYENAVTGAPVGGTEGYGVAGSAVVEAGESASFYLRIEYTDDDSDSPPVASSAKRRRFEIPAGAILPFPDTVLSPNVVTARVPSGQPLPASEYAVRLSEDPRTGQEYPGSDRQIFRTSLIADFDLGAVTLKSLTHYADADTFQFLDGQRDGSAEGTIAYGELNADTATELFTQELRVSSTGDGPWRWTAGALWWNEDVDQVNASYSCFVPATFPETCDTYIAAIGTTEPSNPLHWSRDTEHWSVYAMVEWQFADAWRLGAEGRWSWEDLQVVGPDGSLIIDPAGILGNGVVTVPPPTNPFPVSDDDDFFAGKATLTWQPLDGQLYYASVAQAVKPSGVSTVGAGLTGLDPTPGEDLPGDDDFFRFDQERMLVYELGAKTRWLGDTVQVNGALFYQDFSDKQTDSQVSLPNGVVGIKPVNAGKAEVLGAELDVTWQPLDALVIAGSYSWLDTEYSDFTRETAGVNDIASAGNCVPSGPAFPDRVCTIDLSGRELERAPEHAFNGSVTHRAPLAGGRTWLTEFEARYEDGRYDSAFNTLRFADYWLFDLRMGVETAAWDVIAYVENLTDDDTVRSGFTAPDLKTAATDPGPPFTFILLNSAFYNMPDPRTVGVRASLRFGD